jgi:hypothetical protein
MKSSRLSGTRKDKGNTRKRHVDEWKVVKAKKMRNMGLEYKTMKDKCSDKCRMKCGEKLDESQRKLVFNHFYSLSDTTKQWSYITQIAERKYKCRSFYKGPESRRKFTIDINYLLIRVTNLQ